MPMRFTAALALPIALALAAPGGGATLQQATSPVALTPAQTALVDRARAAGASALATKAAPGGGLILDGELGGARFALAFPANWRGGDGLVFAHGYSTPGTPVAVADDPVNGERLPGGHTMQFAYEDGLAVGHSAYDKDGLGVETGVRNTKRLRDFLVTLGAKRVYVAGDSMGGGIVEALLELYPHAFAGGLARCGVVDSWTSILTRLYDMRAAYNFLTKGTPYALPGDQDVRHSAISSVAPAGFRGDPQTYVWGQLTRVATPVLALFAAAKKDPTGREARIVNQVAAIGGFAPDPGAVAFPLVTAALGADDIAATAGGVPYGNVGKVYHSITMTTEEASALNAGIQRVTADPKAVEYLIRWHQATGRISDPLVTMHNRVDALVPYAQEAALAEAVSKAGRSRYLMQYGVEPMRAPLPVGDGAEAYTHCGFTPEQSKASWEALRQWVETGERPSLDALQ